ncbi:MAG TPA: ankyrin repeat domain-containing protein, partial [Burkholderiaceae bacterium]|nr:ankyrin repeat domain-containing protein [Burkholderiaceae bacterium]
EAIAVRLLAAGAVPRRADVQGVTPLHIVAERGDEPMTRALLQHGADPNVLDHEQRSPLFLALSNHHPEVAITLAQSSHINLRLVTQGYPPRFWAHQMEYDDIARSIDERLR